MVYSQFFKSWQRVVQSWSSLYPNTHTHWQQKNLRNPFQNQWLICLESSWSLYIRNPLGNLVKIKSKLVWNAHGQFAYGILKIQNQHESGLASSWSIYDNFLLISRNRLGELLVGLHVETLRSSSQNQFGLCLESSWSIYTWNPQGIPFKINWKMVWRAPDYFIYGLLEETLSKSSQSWSGTLLVNLHKESPGTSFQNQ